MPPLPHPVLPLPPLPDARFCVLFAHCPRQTSYIPLSRCSLCLLTRSGSPKQPIDLFAVAKLARLSKITGSNSSIRFLLVRHALSLTSDHYGLFIPTRSHKPYHLSHLSFLHPSQEDPSPYRKSSSLACPQFRLERHIVANTKQAAANIALQNTANQVSPRSTHAPPPRSPQHRPDSHQCLR